MTKQLRLYHPHTIARLAVSLKSRGVQVDPHLANLTKPPGPKSETV